MEGYLTARDAARYVGYAVGELPTREEPGLRCFYAMARRKDIKTYRLGRKLLFKRADLDAAVTLQPEVVTDSFERLAAMAIADAQGIGRRVAGGRR